eukprot:4210851-Pyramimonas_sp.AAC.3
MRDRVHGLGPGLIATLASRSTRSHTSPTTTGQRKGNPKVDQGCRTTSSTTARHLVSCVVSGKRRGKRRRGL